MTQPALKQSISFVEFTDSVFSELYHWETEYSYLDMKELADWKNTLIPLGIDLYELAQTDDTVYWWLLQLMSHVDVCKDWKEDFEADEAGKFPDDLPRGVLSEDGIYNLLEQNDELWERLRTFAQEAEKRKKKS